MDGALRSPTLSSRRQGRRSIVPGGILQSIRPALERKASDQDLSENADEFSIQIDGNDQLQDSNRSLSDVEHALQSPTPLSPTKTSRGGIMRKRANFDASNTSTSMIQTSDFDQSASRMQMGIDPILLSPPPLTEIDESMEKSHHKPHRKGASKGSPSGSNNSKSQELFLLRLSILFLLTGCLFLSSKHYQLVHRVKSSTSTDTSTVVPKNFGDAPIIISNGKGGAKNVLLPNAQARIIGGASIVDPREYPWFVLFHGSTICGGVLIASDVVLTAAHCLGAGSPGNGENFVYLNVASRTEDGLDRADKVEILEERRHEMYVDGIYAHDVMLVKLEKGKENKSRSWIQMNLNDGSVPQPNDELSVLGFGDIDISANSIIVPDALQQVNVHAVDYEYCWTMYEAGAVALRDAGMEAQELTKDQLCAEQLNAGTCAGDSGGPLFTKGEEGSQDMLVGIVAWHRGGCGNNFFPDAYSNVTWFADWIVDNACEMASDSSHLPCKS